MKCTPSIAVDNPANEQPDRFRTDASGSVRICMTADSDTRLVASRDGYVANRVGFSVGQSVDTQASHLNIGLTKSATESKPDATMLRGRVLTQATRKPIAGVVVTVVNECDGIAQQTTTDADGRYAFSLLPGCGYRLEAMIGKMGTAGSRIAPDCSGTTDALMFKKGDVITIDNIHYDLDKATIRPDAAAELDKVAVLLRKYPAMTVEMRSHTDSRATDEYNMTLSANRAKSAAAYLQSKGIATRRVVAKGYGEMAPLNKCKDDVDCPESDHQKNRRTEIKILTLE